MAKRDDLEREFDTLIETANPQKYIKGVGGFDPNATWALALLGKSVIRLDRTSSRLAIVNIVLTVVIVAIGVVQVVLMFKCK